MKKAIVNMADTGACESTVKMLESAGYKCALPDDALIAELRHFGLEHVLDVPSMVADWGYDAPRVPRTATPADMFHADLFVDTKAYVNYGRIKERWPKLNVLWCCLNGGDPTKRSDMQLWCNPPCPVLTNNQWYTKNTSAYTCFPPYCRTADRRREAITSPPVCLIHNVERWGYGAIVPQLRMLGVKFHGTNSPDGLLPHAEAMQALSRAPFLLHAKVGDTVAYAVIEAIHSLVPIVCTQFYIDECRLGALLEPGVTCLTFDPTYPEQRSYRAIAGYLSDPEYNLKIARAALARYADLQWRDVDGFAAFMRRHYGD